MNFININWNGAAIVGNSVPSINSTHESIETKSHYPPLTNGYQSHPDIRVEASQHHLYPLPSISSLPPSIQYTSKTKSEKPKKKSKPYSCHYCGHKSSQKQALTQHVQSVHENLKPFNCKWEG